DSGGGAGGGGDLQQTLWPTSAGSTWKYKITDTNKGISEKTVTMLGEMPLPGVSTKVWQMVSDEPASSYKELSWQQVVDGVASRLREDDFRSGALTDSTTWDPNTVKMIAAARAVGFSVTSTAKET